jgi:hypothetical protein
MAARCRLAGDAPFIACALPRQLCRQLDSLARTNGWHLARCARRWCAVWNRLHARDPGRRLADRRLRANADPRPYLQRAACRPAHPAPARKPGLAELATLLEQERLRTPLPAAARDRQSAVVDGRRRLVAGGRRLPGWPRAHCPRRAHGNVLASLPDALPARLPTGARRKSAMKALQIDFVERPPWRLPAATRQRQILAAAWRGDAALAGRPSSGSGSNSISGSPKTTQAIALARQEIVARTATATGAAASLRAADRRHQHRHRPN